MRLYKVKASYITYLSIDIEAENEAEAWDIARDLDGSDFSIDGSEDWQIDEVEFQTEAKYSSQEV